MIFPASEFRNRTTAVQAAMAKHSLAALLLTTEADIRYLTGFLTRFWESPTRPWFLIVPASGDPVAVIPEIGAALMARTWITDIRTWPSPAPQDDGVTLLTDALTELAADGPIATPMEGESHLRMPLTDWHCLTATHIITTDHALLRSQRAIKSPAEVALIKQACQIADRAFARLPEIAAPGTPLDKVFRDFQRLCLDEGADCVPYLAGAAGPQGYSDVISPATSLPLAKGDILMLDTGLQRHGYFCDFDRNISLGLPANVTARAHDRLLRATDAAFNAATPGTPLSHLFDTMHSICGGPTTGRMGHGLGQQLTEWPSITADAQTTLKPGMVLTLEPVTETAAGQILVHEENIVITEVGADWLSTPCTSLPQI